MVRDHVSYLTVLQKAQLLGQNNIFLSKQQDPDGDGGIGLGSLHAYSAELKASTKYAVHFKKVRLGHPASAGRTASLILIPNLIGFAEAFDQRKQDIRGYSKVI